MIVKAKSNEVTLAQVTEMTDEQAQSIEDTKTKVNQMSTEFTKTNEKLETVAKDTEGLKTQVTQTADKLETVSTDVDGMNTKLTQTADKLETVSTDVDGMNTKITQNSTSITTLITDVNDNEKAVDDLSTEVGGYSDRITEAETDIESEVTIRSALIRQYGAGVLVCRPGNSIGALVNANGSFDVVLVSWNGNDPTVGTVLTTLGSSQLRIGESGGSNIQMTDSLFRMYSPDGEQAVQIDSSGGSSTVPVSASRFNVKPSTGTVYCTLEYEPVGEITVSCGTTASFDSGTSGSDTISPLSGGTISVSYNGSQRITLSPSGLSGTERVYIDYDRVAESPVMTLPGYVESNGVYAYGITAGDDGITTPMINVTQTGYFDDIQTADLYANRIFLKGTKIQSMFSPTIAIDTVDHDNLTVAANSSKTFTWSCSKSGYNPRCMVGFDLDNASSSGVNVSKCSVFACQVNQSQDHITCQISNSASKAAKIRAKIWVLYTARI